MMDQAWSCSAARRRLAGAGDLRCRARAHARSIIRTPTRPAVAARGFASSAACAAISRTLAVTFCRCLNIPAQLIAPAISVTSACHRIRADGFQRLVRSLVGGRWHTFDRAPQRSAHRPRADRPGAATPPTWDQHHLRTDLAQVVCRDHARGRTRMRCPRLPARLMASRRMSVVERIHSNGISASGNGRSAPSPTRPGLPAGSACILRSAAARLRWGRVGEGGRRYCARCIRQLPTPTPNPSHKERMTQQS